MALFPANGPALSTGAARASAQPVVFATHPMPRVRQLCAQLRERGLDAWPLPAFGIEPFEPEPLAAAAAQAHAHPYDWIVLVSPSAVQTLAEAFGARGWPAQGRIAVVGRGSFDAVVRCDAALGARVFHPAVGADAQALLAEPALGAVAGCRVLLVRGEQGSPALAAALRARGAQVDECRAYRRCAACWPADSVEALDRGAAAGAPAAFILTVTDAAASVRQALAERSPAHWEWARAQRAVAIHPRIAEQCRLQGWRTVREAGAGLDALVGALESD